MSTNSTSTQTTVEFQLPVRNHRTKTAKPRREISPERRAYLREYYQKNKERAREYQRQYSLKHRRKSTAPGCSSSGTGREAFRTVFNMGDIMQSPTEKSLKILEQILKGERFFTM